MTYDEHIDCDNQLKEAENKIIALEARCDKLKEALRLFIKVKELKDDMNECIDERKEGLVGILVMSDELAKKYQGIHRERENLKPKVYLTIKQALKKAEKL
jgi:hypothetical protein